MHILETPTTHTSYDPELRLVFMVAKPRAHFDVEQALENKAAALSLTQGEHVGLVFEASEGKNSDVTTTAEMRALSASPAYNEKYFAVALVSPSVSMKILGNFYLRINNPAVPTRFFSTRDQAIVWMKKQLQAFQLQHNS